MVSLCAFITVSRNWSPQGRGQIFGHVLMFFVC